MQSPDWKTTGALGLVVGLTISGLSMVSRSGAELAVQAIELRAGPAASTADPTLLVVTDLATPAPPGSAPASPAGSPGPAPRSTPTVVVPSVVSERPKATPKATPRATPKQVPADDPDDCADDDCPDDDPDDGD